MLPLVLTIILISKYNNFALHKVCKTPHHSTWSLGVPVRETVTPKAFTSVVSFQRGIVGEIPQLKCSHVCFCAKWAHSADLLETDQWDPLLRPLLPFSSDSSQTMNNKLIKMMTAWRRGTKALSPALTTDTQLSLKPPQKNTGKHFIETP